MKRKFLLIPMLAGLMLAASCSKDDGTSVADDVITPSSEPVVEQPVAKKTYPLTIQAKKETSVSKIGLGTDGLSQVFEKGEKLTLVCTDGDAGLEPITLGISGGIGTTSATFSISDMGADAVGKTFRAVIKGTDYADEIQSSTDGLEDAVRKYCYLEATKTFVYEDGKAIPTLTLADQRAYIAFTVADGQKQVSLKKDGDADYVWKPVSTTEPKVWFAVSAGSYSTRLINKPLTTEAGYVYNAKSTKVVDLGPGWNILWKTTNETANPTLSFNSSNSTHTEYSGEKYYYWSNACAFGRMNGESYERGTADPFRLPTQAELEALISLAQSGLPTHNGMACKEFKSDYGSVFFPAAGNNGGSNASTYGCYLSGDPIDADYAHSLGIYSSYAPNMVKGYVFAGLSVRLVRGL